MTGIDKLKDTLDWLNAIKDAPLRYETSHVASLIICQVCGKQLENPGPEFDPLGSWHEADCDWVKAQR